MRSLIDRKDVRDLGGPIEVIRGMVARYDADSEEQLFYVSLELYSAALTELARDGMGTLQRLTHGRLLVLPSARANGLSPAADRPPNFQLSPSFRPEGNSPAAPS